MLPATNLPEGAATNPVHVIITPPNAIMGTEAARQQIIDSLPKPQPGHHWSYCPMGPQPLRFATSIDADGFMQDLAAGKHSDKWFVPVMRYDQLRQKWAINADWGRAFGELVVFMQEKDVTADDGIAVTGAPDLHDERTEFPGEIKPENN